MKKIIIGIGMILTITLLGFLTVDSNDLVPGTEYHTSVLSS